MTVKKMKFAYIAYPVSGNIAGNLIKVTDIGRTINLLEPNTVPISQFFFDCYCLNDDIPAERERGIKNDIAILSSGIISGVRLYGNRISNGMKAEIKLALSLNIPIIPMTKETTNELGEFIALIKKRKKMLDSDQLISGDLG
jgi:hypothetical protein